MNQDFAMLRLDIEDRCNKASLTCEQTADVIAYALDTYNGGEQAALAAIAFLLWKNDRDMDNWVAEQEERVLTAPSGLLEEVVA